MSQDNKHIIYCILFADSPYITRFSINPNPTHAEVVVMCEVDSNPRSNITILSISEDSSHILAEVQGGTEIKHSITSATCPPVTSLTCLAENAIGISEKTFSPMYKCKSFCRKSNCRTSNVLRRHHGYAHIGFVY